VTETKTKNDETEKKMVEQKGRDWKKMVDMDVHICPSWANALIRPLSDRYPQGYLPQ
jgi:hypothetical protein